MGEFLAVLGWILTLILFGVLLTVIAHSITNDEIIHHGCGQYNSQTGVFEWKDK